MPRFTIRRSFDAWQHYSAKVEAETFLEAVEIAKNTRHPKSLNASWEDDGIQEFDEMQLVSVTDEAGDTVEFAGPDFKAEGF